ncbi:MAG: hypothetical protein JSV03_02425 [Planctomycetota bacterium]|nr:MAG: hypothetical protein JSV03_02425 [Planctomycetota bacterium]
MIDERTELLINRKLDGELSRAESLELDKLLIRSPEARALLEEYQGNDSLAAETLHKVISNENAVNDFTASWNQSIKTRKQRVRYLTTGAAIAAVITLAVLIGSIPTDQPTQQPIVHNTTDMDNKIDEPSMVAHAAQNKKLTPLRVIEGPRREQERTLRDVFGVYDPQTKSVYFLEANHTQTTAVPVSMNY